MAEDLTVVPVPAGEGKADTGIAVAEFPGFLAEVLPTEVKFCTPRVGVFNRGEVAGVDDDKAVVDTGTKEEAGADGIVGGGGRGGCLGLCLGGKAQEKQEEEDS